jgi:hypothetical protein
MFADISARDQAHSARESLRVHCYVRKVPGSASRDPSLPVSLRDSGICLIGDQAPGAYEFIVTAEKFPSGSASLADISALHIWHDLLIVCAGPGPHPSPAHLSPARPTSGLDWLAT